MTAEPLPDRATLIAGRAGGTCAFVNSHSPLTLFRLCSRWAPCFSTGLRAV